MKKLLLVAFLFSSIFVEANDASVYFIQPLDGTTVSSPVTVKFGLSNFGVAPAGVERDGTGHHHLLIDAPLPNLTLPIPADANHYHFGGGQTETQITLPKGKHTLQLLMGNHFHIPHAAPIYSDVITITVK